MDDQGSSPAASMSEERFKQIIAVLIAVVTVLTTVIAFLQSDAGARDDRANRDSKRYATEAMGRQVSGDARVNYDYSTAYQTWYELDMLTSSAGQRGDTAAAQRYQTLRDRLPGLSPLLAAPYFDAATGNVNIAQYEADVYLVEITALTERFVAATAVKEAWDYKSNTYIIHITLLAVALFLLGLSATISSPVTRWIFSGVGVAIAAVAVVWAATLWAQPVYDLRDRGGAIDAYAKGVGLAHQARWPEAITAFDQALQAAPDYANALAQRASANAALDKPEAAVADYEKARAAGDASANTAGELAWDYYLLGRFDDAVAMNRTALKASPDELWIQFDLALSLLASGQLDAAKAEYAIGMNAAAKQVADAKAAGQEPPSYLWWGLDDAANSAEGLLAALDTGEGAPPRAKIVNAEAVKTAGEELIGQLKSLAVALEYTGKPPAGALAAKITPFQFGEPVYDDQGELQDYNLSDTFAYGIKAVGILFDYEGMKDGQEVVFKVYIDGEEDPSWRLIAPWDLGPSGSASRSLSLEYSDAFVLDPGEYVVEGYVDSHLAQRGGFVVEKD